jgi:hypothetical protein
MTWIAFLKTPTTRSPQLDARDPFEIVHVPPLCEKEALLPKPVNNIELLSVIPHALGEPSQREKPVVN